MQLDHTRIAIRERGFLEILDLSLRTIRAYAGPLAVAWLIGAVPVIALNSLLLVWLFDDCLSPGDYMGAGFLVLMLVVWELPLATAPITLYLGEALFVARPSPRRLLSSFFGSLGQIFWYQACLRALLTLPVFTWLFLFGAWPYTNEVILLERNQMFRRRGRQEMTTGRRIRRLHTGFGGEVFGRWVSSLAFGGVLLVSLEASVFYVLYLLFGELDFETNDAAVAVCVVASQIGLWLVLGGFAVVRYLSYLDLRIRREGWEVELLMRAEEARQKRRWMGATS